ncbi:MAG: putative bifunctional diguanylate cyclase/phosphodiesterase [Microthrixaceae bacterium]
MDPRPDIDQVRRERAMLLEVFELTDDLAVLLDADGRVLHLNAAARRFYGIDGSALDRVVGENWEPATDGLDQVVARIAADPDQFGRWSGEIEAARPDGTTVPMLLQLLAHRDHPDGPIEFFSAVARDISDRKRLEESLEQQATHDPLTGLPNRLLLFERIRRALAGLRDVGARHSVALLFIDLDHFKHVNDNLGHELGDRILAEVAQRILSVVRPGDTVARFGGDEFVVLCERLEQPEDAVVIAHRIDDALGPPARIDGRELQLGASIGISYADVDDVDPSAMLRDADTAMYRAKVAGRGRWVVFDEALRQQAHDRRRVETALRTSRHGDDLELRYQPVVDLRTRRVTGVETLLRWRHGGELMSPAQFIPVAEETGLIVPMGAWVLRTACAQAARWQQLPGWSDLEVAVNVSARQVEQDEFATVVAEIIEATGLAGGSLWLEITESALLDDVQTARTRLDVLRALGARIALDDFGTGYSSLTYLRRFPVDAVKLDQSFVQGIGVDAGDAAIVEAVVGLAVALGKVCIAEGVETADQADALTALGCDSAQGYLFSEPLTADEVTELLVAATRRSWGPDAGDDRSQGASFGW